MADTYKTLSQITDMVNAYTDDDPDDDSVLNSANIVIANINITLGTIFPEFTELEIEYKAIPVPWTEVLVLGICWVLKVNGDEEQLAALFLQRYTAIMAKFSNGYAIPEEYQGPNFGKTSYATIDWTQLYNNNKKKVNLNMGPFKLPYIGFVFKD